MLRLFFMLMNAIRMSKAAMSTSSGKKGALIFLHGLGDTPDGWSELEYSLPNLRPKLEEIAFVFPPAPVIPITINGGMKMPGWFDLYDWPIAVGSRDDKAGLLRGVDQIRQEISKLNQQGIPTNKIVVGGFSQGGAVALLTAYRKSTSGSDEPLAGCVGLSAWLTLPMELDVSMKVAQKTPLFWGHGRFDDKVLFPQQRFGVEKLRAAGVTVTDEQYDMGHSSHPQELRTMAEFVENVIFGTANSNAANQDL